MPPNAGIADRDRHVDATACAVPHLRDVVHHLLECRIRERVELELDDRPPAREAQPDRGAGDPGLADRACRTPARARARPGGRRSPGTRRRCDRRPRRTPAPADPRRARRPAPGSAPRTSSTRSSERLVAHPAPTPRAARRRPSRTSTRRAAAASRSRRPGPPSRTPRPPPRTPPTNAVVRRAVREQPRPVARDRVAGAGPLDLLVGAVPGGIVGGGVRADPVRHRLDQRRAVAGAGPVRAPSPSPPGRRARRCRRRGRPGSRSPPRGARSRRPSAARSAC